MKKILLFIWCIGSFSLVNAQTKIFLKNDSVIHCKEVKAINDSLIIYEQDDQLKVLPFVEAAFIQSASRLIYLDKDLRPSHYQSPEPNKTEPRPKSNVPSWDTLPIDSHVFIFKSTPFNLLEPEPYLQAVLEFNLTSKLSVQQQVGYYLDYGDNWFLDINNEFQNLRGFNLRTGFKFYLDQKRRYLNGGYISGQFMYKRTKTSYSFQNEVWNINGEWQFSTFSNEMIKQVFAGSFLAGYQFISKNNLVVDLYAGFGLRYRIKDTTTTTTDSDWNFTNSTRRVDYRILPHINGGIFFGFSL